MEKAISELTSKIESGGNGLTESAQKIANIALGSFRERLLDKALNIAKAIISFEDELKTPSKS